MKRSEQEMLDEMFAEDGDELSPSMLPAVRHVSMGKVIKEAGYELEAFTPVSEEDSDTVTTKSDLQILNNQLALCSAAIPHIHTIQVLLQMSVAVTKLVEARRKVKKLAYGSTDGKGGRTFEIIE